jgi:hypothetical protein
MTRTLGRHQWRQIGGDVDPGSHGGTIARFDEDAIELIEIQPVMAYQGRVFGPEVGYPFWTNVAYYEIAYLLAMGLDVQASMVASGLEPEDIADLSADDRALAIAECCLSYGLHTEDGPHGFARNILPEQRVKWWGSKGLQGWRYLADEDREFRQLVRERA